MADGLLQCRTEYSDRYVYSKQFMPLRLETEDNDPILTFYQREAIRSYLARNPEGVRPALERGEVRELLDRAGVSIDVPARAGAEPDIDAAARRRPEETRPTEEVTASIAKLGDEHDQIRRDRLDKRIADVAELLHVARVAESPLVADSVTKLVEEKLSALMAESAALGSGPGEGTDEIARAHNYSAARAQPGAATTATPDPIDVIVNLLKSEIGYLFYDRTRIRPSGFAIGEHLYALSLAPGEEVVLEQRTFSKRQLTFEEQTEEERQQDLELSSSLSTELQEGAERQRNRSNSSGFTAGGTLGGNIEGVEVSANVGYSTSLAEANNQTRTRSVKENTTSTQRVAAKYRAAHKVSFKVSSEEGFEASSKRVFRNPNRFTPINLHYFKIMQVLELMQQRYGVRLAWAPSIKDPGFDFHERIRRGREAILKKAEEITLPPRPAEPVRADKPARWESSGLVEANKWGVMCDMRYDYPIEVPIPVDYIWDGNAQAVRDSLSATITNVNRSTNIYVVDDPWIVGDVLMTKVHVGVDWTNPIGGCGTIYLKVSARFIADPAAADPAYQQAYAKWLQDMATWQTEVSNRVEAARAQAAKEADAWEQEMLRSVNPLGELMNRVISHEFATSTRDESWEIELWQQIFDWSAASFVLYPAWWSDLPMRDPLKSPTDFFNASWAKLYVPVRIGFERMALRWIFGKQVQTPLQGPLEAAFTTLEEELKAYRTQHFGDERETGLEPGAGDCEAWKERFLCLARWTDVMPTDGTHLEVVQSATAAADQYSRDEVEAVRLLQKATTDSALQDIELKKKALGGMKKEVDTGITITVEGGGG